METDLIGTLRLPARIHFGFGVRSQLPELAALSGQRVFAVVDPFLIGTGLMDEVDAGIKARGLQMSIFSDIQPELPVSSLDAAADAAGDFRPDVILAIGGGSALDAAKLIGLLISRGGPLARYYGENAVPGPITPIIAVPTTAGTGSEVTPVAVVSDPQRELKVGISSPFLIPTIAVVDPEFTLGAPASVTAHSGIDALVHAVESYTAQQIDVDWTGTLPVFTGRNIFTETLALDAIRRIATWLPTAVKEPRNRRAREELALGSLQAGMAFGPTGTHLSHALQYPIGALTHTPHGLGTGLMLPYVMEACRADSDTALRIAAIGSVLGSNATTTTALADDAIASVIDLNDAIGIPASLAEIGLEGSHLSHVAELALASSRLIGIAPIASTEQSLLKILKNAHAGILSESRKR